jgi:phosphoglucosamine mutase
MLCKPCLIRTANFEGLTFAGILVQSLNMQLFGTSGVRRLVNRELIDLSLKVGYAVGAIYNNVIVGRDTRTSGSVLRHAITSGILASGSRCSDAGIVPTPTLAFVTREFKAGVMITASHNPPQYNGIKLLNPDGSAFSAEQQDQIEELVNGTKPLNLSWERMQVGEVFSTAVDKHVDRIKQDFPAGIKLKVVVDSGCGAAYFITAHLLTQLGCEVIALNGYPNGIFPHDIEPIEANLGELISMVSESRADLGIAHDGDADRMMAVDERGRFIPGDKLMAILARACGTKKLVTTIDASMSIEDLHFKVRRTKVGDPYVSEELKKGGEFGGEPSGAWVFPGISLCPDGIYAAARIASVASRHKLSVLVDSLPSYPVIRGNISGSVSSMTTLVEKLQAELQPVSSDMLDGVKLNFKDGWLLVRPSGTEPKIRITSEARDKQVAQDLFDRGVGIINNMDI